MQKLENTDEKQTPDRQLASICWTATATAMGFLCFIHVGVALCFVSTRAALPLVAPAAFVGALASGAYLARRQRLDARVRLWALGTPVALTLISLALSAFYFDLSWDGQWYHQVAIYNLKRDWNPWTEPMRAFKDNLQLWVRHYAKGPWYMAAAIFATTGHVEWGKLPTPLAFAAMFLAVLAACLDWGLGRRRALTIATLVTLNPVATSLLVTYLVDGLMIASLTIYASALFGLFRRARPEVIFAGIAAAITCINSKFTGLVYLGFVCAGATIYCFLRRRDLLTRFIGWNTATILLATVVLGYNPYVTNVIHRGHPFYPVLGTKAFPSLAAQGREGIERYETPKNMVGKSRFVRFAYAIFSHPGVQPYNRDPNAHLQWPFMVTPKDLDGFRYHETRAGGFGPLFSGLLLMSLVLAGWVGFTPGQPRLVMLLACSVIVLSLLVSVHCWWARYGPQLWLLPLTPLTAALARPASRKQTVFAWALAAILLTNALAVATVRMKWETVSSLKLRRQLTQLSQSGRVIDIRLNHFEEPIGERLKAWGIPFRNVGRTRMPGAQGLMSVVEGYPGGVLFRVAADDRPTSGPVRQNAAPPPTPQAQQRAS